MHPQMSHDASRILLQLLIFTSQDFDASGLILVRSTAWYYLEEVMESVRLQVSTVKTIFNRIAFFYILL